MGRRPLYKKCSEQLTNFESVLNTSGERILGPENPPNSRQLETEDHKSVKFVSQKRGNRDIFEHNKFESRK